MNSHLLPLSPNTLALSYQHCASYANGSPIFKNVQIETFLY